MFPLFKHLFVHGEGGDGAGAAPGAEAPAAEESGVKTPDAGEKKRLTREERRARLEEQLKAEQAQAQQPQAAQQQPEQSGKLFSEAELNERIQKAVTGRVKNLKDSEQELTAAKAEIERLQKLLAPLAERQGIAPAADGRPDLEAIEKKNRQARIEEYSLENGVSEEFAEQRLQMQDRIDEQERQLREYKAAEEARQRDQEMYARFQKNRQQAEAFREKMPGFDLLKEMKEVPEFSRLLSYGVPVENAYYAIHHDELMAVGQQAAAIQAKRALASSIQAGQSMPAEGGLGRSPAASPQRAADLTFDKARRAEIRRRMRRGEEVIL